MAPRAKVVAFFRTLSGEVVADALEFFVEDPFETKVSSANPLHKKRLWTCVEMFSILNTIQSEDKTASN